MSKFAAIEARMTKYPASTNDVVWLVERVRELAEAVEYLELLRDDGPENEGWQSPELKDLIARIRAALGEHNLPQECPTYCPACREHHPPYTPPDSDGM
jgi:hypothetical protein